MPKMERVVVPRHRLPRGARPFPEQSKASRHAGGRSGPRDVVPPYPAARGNSSASRRLGRRHVLVLATVLACITGAIWATSADAGTNSRTRLLVSMSPDRSAPVSLDGARLSGPSYIFVKTSRNTVSEVVFTLDPGTPTA